MAKKKNKQQQDVVLPSSSPSPSSSSSSCCCCFRRLRNVRSVLCCSAVIISMFVVSQILLFLPQHQQQYFVSYDDDVQDNTNSSPTFQTTTTMMSNQNNNNNNKTDIILLDFRAMVDKYYYYHYLANTGTDTTAQNTTVIEKIIEKDVPERITALEEYILWHDQQRQNFPDNVILTHPLAPNLTIVYMDPTKHHGGLTDRMKGLGQVLRKSYTTTKSVVFFKWYQAPYDLEQFLIPNLINWTLPYHANLTATPQQLQDWANDDHNNNTMQQQPSSSNRRHVELIRFTSSNGSYLKPFGIFWHALFQPSAQVQNVIDETKAKWQLQPFHYHAIHLRLGHPAYRGKVEKLKNHQQHQHQQHGNSNNNNNSISQQVDIHGQDIFPLMGYQFRRQAIQNVMTALACLEWIVTETHGTNNNNNNTEWPVYLYSDSMQLIQTVLSTSSSNDDDNNDNNTTTHDINNNNNNNDGDDDDPEERQEYLESLQELEEWKRRVPVVGRPNAAVTHIEAQQDHNNNNNNNDDNHNDNHSSSSSLEAHMSTFVDLYLASQASCLSMGVGRFAYMAGQISGTTCWTIHTLTNSKVSSKWGMVQMQKHVPSCPLIGKTNKKKKKKTKGKT